MSLVTATTDIQTGAPPSSLMPGKALMGGVTVGKLVKGQEREALAFLSARPLHAVHLTSLIRDNGLVSPLNRGDFYACWNAADELIGVALIGHAMLFETQSGAALEAFARLAQSNSRAHVLLGEEDKIAQFWQHYAEGGQAARVLCRELLMEIRWPVIVRREVKGLRQATLADIDLVMPIQAAMAYEESGVNPMQSDPEGFRLRSARRIEQGRVWVIVEDDELIFKADIISETPDVTYLEGVYVHLTERGQGYGLRCLSQLSRTLLARARSICLLVNEENKDAQSFYEHAGFQLQTSYETIFLQQQT